MRLCGHALKMQCKSKLDPKKKRALGQFMTPFKIAEFMAGLFSKKKDAVLLDAGAGIGSLTLAASKVLSIKRSEAWELDPVMVSYLSENLKGLGVPYPSGGRAQIRQHPPQGHESARRVRRSSLGSRGHFRRAHQHSALADLQLAARISAPAKQRRAQRAPGAVETDLQDCAYSSAQNAARSLMLKTQRLFAVGLFGGLSMNCTLGTICTCGNSCSR